MGRTAETRTPTAHGRSLHNRHSPRNGAGRPLIATAGKERFPPLYIGRAVEHLRAAGHPAPDHLLAHTAPLGWTHISLTGDYLWREPDASADDFLPLRLNQRLSSVA